MCIRKRKGRLPGGRKPEGREEGKREEEGKEGKEGLETKYNAIENYGNPSLCILT